MRQWTIRVTLFATAAGVLAFATTAIIIAITDRIGEPW